MAKRNSKSSTPRSPGHFAYVGLERTIHEKARLGIMTSLLSQADGISFNDLKALCNLTDGNLHRHLDVLVNDGLVTVEKECPASGRAKTVCRLTARGRQRFLAYLEELQRVIADARTVSPLGAPRLNWSTKA